MITNITKKIISFFINNEIIENDKKELYSYGIRQGILMILNISTIIILGLLFKLTWEIILFITAFIPLRIYAGGYHAKTENRCYLFSIILSLIVIVAIKFISVTYFQILCLTIIGSIIIVALAPIEDSNKPLSQIEVEIYKKNTRIILVIEMLIVIFLLSMKLLEMAFVVAISIFIMSFMLVAGKFKLK